jgi:hypothetical protein
MKRCGTQSRGTEAPIAFYGDGGGDAHSSPQSAFQVTLDAAPSQRDNVVKLRENLVIPAGNAGPIRRERIGTGPEGAGQDSPA